MIFKIPKVSFFHLNLFWFWFLCDILKISFFVINIEQPNEYIWLIIGYDIISISIKSAISILVNQNQFSSTSG